MPAEVVKTNATLIDASRLDDLLAGAYAHGFSLVIIPGLSAAHAEFATQVERLKGLFERPLIGWIAGVHMNDLSSAKPKVFDGATGAVSDDRILIMHAQLPEGVEAHIGIINLFEQDRASKRIQFLQTSFTADACLIDGEPRSFYQFVKQENLDLRLPLVADYSGEKINVSFRELDDAKREVSFYAPVVAGVEYRFAFSLGITTIG